MTVTIDTTPLTVVITKKDTQTDPTSNASI